MEQLHGQTLKTKQADREMRRNRLLSCQELFHFHQHLNVDGHQRMTTIHSIRFSRRVLHLSPIFRLRVPMTVYSDYVLRRRCSYDLQDDNRNNAFIRNFSCYKRLLRQITVAS